MAFEEKNFRVLGYANNFTNWHYVTSDTLDTVMSPGYFNKTTGLVRKNDLIILNTKDHNSTVWVKEVLDSHVVKVTKQSNT